MVPEFSAAYVIGKTALIVHGHPYPPVGSGIEESHLVADHGPEVAFLPEGLERVLPPVVAGHACIRAYPEVAVGIFDDLMYEIRIEPEVLLAIDAEAGAVVAVESLESPYPDKAPGILEYLADTIIGKVAVGSVDVREAILAPGGGEPQ